MRKAEAVYSQLVIICTGRDCEPGRGVRKHVREEKGGLQERPDWRLWELEVGSLCDWLGECIWPSAAGPELEETQVREAGGPWPNPDSCGPIAADLVVGIPGLVTAEVVGLSSVAVGGLDVVRLYTESLRPTVDFGGPQPVPVGLQGVWSPLAHS